MIPINAKQSCMSCLYYCTFDWPLIGDCIKDAKLDVETQRDFRQFYSGVNGRCMKIDRITASTDWCNAYTVTPNGVIRDLWPSTKSVFVEKFSKLLRGSK